MDTVGDLLIFIYFFFAVVCIFLMTGLTVWLLCLANGALQENSFEQMCINYANENLQFYFNKHIFKLEQQEYAKEKIQWQNISYTDNQPVINLIAKKPIGVLHLLDDESNFPKATDGSFLEKCHYNHALNELYFRPRMSCMEFGIKHYAGQVNRIGPFLCFVSRSFIFFRRFNTVSYSKWKYDTLPFETTRP